MRLNRATLSVTAACVALALAGTASAQEAAPSPGQALDRATFIAQMDAQFQRLDGDNNGMVVAAEIIASQQQAAQAEALRQNQRVFAQLDRNGDGMLDTAEFAALAKPSAASVDATPMMSQFDADGDGIITLVEYRIATQANFDRVDTDRDGLITDMEERAAGIQP